MVRCLGAAWAAGGCIDTGRNEGAALRGRHAASV